MSKTLAQYLDGENLWGEIRALANDPVTLPFLTQTSEIDLNIQTVLRYGDRILFGKFENTTIAEAAAILLYAFEDHWRELIEFAAEDIGISVAEKEVIDDDVIRTKETGSEAETVNKVSAFNTNDLLEDSGNVINTNEEVAGEDNRKVIKKRVSINDAYENLSKADRLNIKRAAVSDVARFLSLAVY